MAEALQARQPTFDDLTRLYEAEREALEYLPVKNRRTGKLTQK